MCLGSICTALRLTGKNLRNVRDTSEREEKVSVSRLDQPFSITRASLSRSCPERLQDCLGPERHWPIDVGIGEAMRLGTKEGHRWRNVPLSVSIAYLLSCIPLVYLTRTTNCHSLHG